MSRGEQSLPHSTPPFGRTNATSDSMFSPCTGPYESGRPAPLNEGGVANGSAPAAEAAAISEPVSHPPHELYGGKFSNESTQHLNRYAYALSRDETSARKSLNVSLLGYNGRKIKPPQPVILLALQ